MVGTNVGWAIVQTKHGSNVDPAPAIMRTTDGGHTWYDVTPPEPYNISAGPILNGTPVPSPNNGVLVQGATFQTDFISGNDAWIALIPSGTGETPLSFTHDGGKTWQESSIPVNNIKQMSFIDAQHGWVLTELPPVSTLDDADVESVALFQTVNGGETWVKVSQSSFDRQLNDTTTGSLPASGIKAGFTFMNVQTGWMVGQTQHNNFFWFYVTHDGGRTWQHQNLPQPQPAIRPKMTDAGPQFQLQPPVFFGNEGVLAFTIPTDGKYASSSNTANNEAVEIYISHDGGNTWQSTPSPLSTSGIHSGIFSNVQFVDASHGSVSINNQIFFVHRNANSDSWTVTSTTIQGEVLQSNFVSPSTGWLLVNGVQPNSYKVNPDAQWTLYQTTDGGKTWAHIHYNVMGQQVQTTQKLNAGWVAVASYSGTGSKVMFLHGQIVPSKQWGLVLTCSGTGDFTAMLLDSSLVSNAEIGIGAKVGCPVQVATGGSTSHGPQVAGGVQGESYGNVTWNFLIVECTNSQGCKSSPIG